MKILINILILIITFTAFAEKQFDIVPITLPYPSIVLEDICAYNSTILVRSGNKVYKSTDDGDSWKIAFESEKNVRQLYSLDAHTIFVVGDSGMTYRTFDYGETWEDISFVTTENFTGIAAKNYEDYLMISEQEYIFHKKGMESELLPIKSNSIVPLYNIIYDTNYVFGGGVKIDRFYEYDIEMIEFVMPYYVYNGKGVRREQATHLKAEDTGHEEIFSDSLKLFSSHLGRFYSVVNKGNAGTILNNVIDVVFELNSRGVVIKNDRITYIDAPDENIYIFSREGYWVTADTNYFFNTGYTRVKLLHELEHQFLGITPINCVFKTDSNEFIISSNHSTIYKVKMNEVISSVKSDTSSNVKLLGNTLLLNRDTELLNIYNYLGASVDYEIVSNNIYRLPKGFNFVTYTREGITSTIKVSVIE